MPITIGLRQRTMLAIAAWFYSRIGMPLTYEVRTRNLNNKRQTSGVLTGSYPTLQEALERQQRAAVGMRPDFIVTITAVVTVAVRGTVFLNRPADRTAGPIAFGSFGPRGAGSWTNLDKNDQLRIDLAPASKTTLNGQEIYSSNKEVRAWIERLKSRRVTAKAYGTVLTPRSDDGKDNSPG